MKPTTTLIPRYAVTLCLSLARLVTVCADSPLLRRDWLRAAALRDVLLTPVPLIGHERFVYGKVLDVGLQYVHHVGLTGNHNKLGEKSKNHTQKKKSIQRATL